MQNTVSHRRPSAAFILATVALFVALGGTGYAATRAPAARAHKSAKPLTSAKVNALIAKYVTAHHTVTPLYWHDTTSSTASKYVAKFGPWKAVTSCVATGANPGETFSVSGPGKLLASNGLAPTNGAAGALYENAGGPGGVVGVDDGGSLNQTIFLTDGSLRYELTYNMAPAAAGSDTTCLLAGELTKLS